MATDPSPGPTDEPSRGWQSVAEQFAEAADWLAAFARAQPAAALIAGTSGGAIGLWLAGRQRGKAERSRTRRRRWPSVPETGVSASAEQAPMGSSFRWRYGSPRTRRCAT